MPGLFVFRCVQFVLKGWELTLLVILRDSMGTSSRYPFISNLTYIQRFGSDFLYNLVVYVQANMHIYVVHMLIASELGFFSS